VDPSDRPLTDTEIAAAIGMTKQGPSHARRMGRVNDSRDPEDVKRQLAENTDAAKQRPKLKTVNQR
jgi:hypothetical protein